jgi:hypothetical protein
MDQDDNSSTNGACSHGTPYNRPCPSCMGPGPGSDPHPTDDFSDAPHPTTPQGMSADYVGAADPFETDDEPASVDPVAETQLRDLEQREVELENDLEAARFRIAELERRLASALRLADTALQAKDSAEAELAELARRNAELKDQLHRIAVVLDPALA